MNTEAPPSVLLYSQKTYAGLYHVFPPSASGQRSQYSDLATDWTGPKSWFDSRQGQNILSLLQNDHTGSGAHTTSYSMGNGGYLSLRQRVHGVKLTTSPPPSTEVKNEWNYTSTSSHIFMVSKGKVFTLQTLLNTW